MDAVVKEEKNMIEPKKEVEDTVELKEPKVELIDEMDVKKEELDEDEYKHLIPYEYRDFMEQQDVEQESVNSRKKPEVECQLCGKNIVYRSFHSLENHAVVHTSLTKFSCPVVECEYRSMWIANVRGHLRSNHAFVNPTAKDVVRREFSHEDNVELMRKVGECFPGVAKPELRTVPPFERHVYSCQLCQSSITEPTKVSKFSRRSHASCHALQTMKIELTIEQKLERERMVIQCFPELKDDSKHRIELIKKDERIDREKEETSIEKTKKKDELEEKPTPIIDKEDDIQLSGRKRKADQGTFKTRMKRK